MPSTLGPTLLIGAATGAVNSWLSYSAAKSHNKAIKEAADRSFDLLGHFLAQIKLDKLLQTASLARNARVALGGALNVAPDGQAAIETIASRIAAGVATDQFAIAEDARRREEATKSEMTNVLTGAANSMVDPAGAAIGGAAGGFQQGVQTMQVFQSLGDQDRQSHAQDVAFGQQQRLASGQSELNALQIQGQVDQNSYYRSLLTQMHDHYQPNAYTQYQGVQVFAPMLAPNQPLNQPRYGPM